MDEVVNERKMMAKLKHKSIVGMQTAWAENGYLYLLYDFALNGDMSSFLRANAPLSLKLG